MQKLKLVCYDQILSNIPVLNAFIYLNIFVYIYLILFIYLCMHMHILQAVAHMQFILVLLAAQELQTSPLCIYSVLISR